MSTLAIRLSGPLQSWGEHARFLTRPTLDAPTRSGLLGLARAALGHGRHDPLTAINWLLNLEMAVRVDQTGRLRTDFHTVNAQAPILTPGTALAKQERAARGTVITGSGRPWVIKGEPQTLVTDRHYREDATYLWLVEGPDADLARLVDALTSPTWALSLGRKKCVPDWLLTLAVLGMDTLGAAQTVPRLAHAPASSEEPVELVLHTTGLQARHRDQATPADPVNDTPLGSHPHDGHVPTPRSTLLVTPPVTDRAGLLAWLTTETARP